FLHTRKIQEDEEAYGRELYEQLDRQHAENYSARPRGREETENRVACRRNRNRDREHVVHDQRRPRYDAGLLAKEPRRNDVTAATERKLFDDPAIGVGDDEDGERRRQCQADRQIGMRSESLKCLFGPVRGRRQAVGSEADPREQRNERDFVEDFRLELALPAQQDALHTCGPRLPEIRESRGGGRHRSLLEAYGVS